MRKLTLLSVHLAAFASMLICASSSNASPPLYYPDEPQSASFVVQVLGEDCAATWFYDAGHRWQRDGFYGHGDDCKKLRPEVISQLGLRAEDFPSWLLTAAAWATMRTLTHAQKDALWSAVFNIDPSNPLYAATHAANVLNDTGARALHLAVPAPTDAPPSGWVTQATAAYKRSEGIGTYSLVAVGTVPLGVACNAKNYLINASGARYHALVNRSSVVMKRTNNYTPPLPTTVYASCVP